MRNSDRVLNNTAPKDFGRYLLFLGEPIIKAVTEDVCVNESGHDGKDPLGSNLEFPESGSRGRARLRCRSVA